MRTIGLTGGIASGKSTVAAMLTRLGGVVIDADLLAREAVAVGSEALAAIAAEFGSGLLREDGTLDRKKLGSIVFSDTAARRRLEEITHPPIRRLARQRLERHRDEGAQVVFYMAPLLLEAGSAAHVEEVWVVYVDQATQLQRLRLRDGLTEEEALQRIHSQLPMEEKAKRARVVLDNRGSREQTEEQVREAWQELLQR